MTKEPGGWSGEHSAELYNLDGWGQPYFRVAEDGHCVVHPDGTDGPAVPLTGLVDLASERGLSLPLLVRFDGILRHRLHTLVDEFTSAADQYGFAGRYRPVYPIKVNQQRHVVEERRPSRRHTRSEASGLEAGSKPELHDRRWRLLDTPGSSDHLQRLQGSRRISRLALARRSVSGARGRSSSSRSFHEVDLIDRDASSSARVAHSAHGASVVRARLTTKRVLGANGSSRRVTAPSSDLTACTRSWSPSNA